MLFQSFLSDRQQRVVLNGQHSKWPPVQAGVPQGSILEPLPFLIYIDIFLKIWNHRLNYLLIPHYFQQCVTYQNLQIY